MKEAGYTLPAGYGMLQGTSMSSPQAAGASALLLSAAKQQHIELTPAKLRAALTSTAKKIADVPAHAQGSGLINIVGRVGVHPARRQGQRVHRQGSGRHRDRLSS